MMDTERGLEKITFLVVSEGGIPIYSYPEVDQDRENIFSFLFGALTSLGEAMWGDGEPIKLEKGERRLIAEKKEKIFFSFLIEPEVNEHKVLSFLENATAEFITRFGKEPDQVTPLGEREKAKFSNWLKDQLTSIMRKKGRTFNGKDVLGEKIGEVVRKTETKRFTCKVKRKRNVARNQFLICRDTEDGRLVLARVDKIEKQTGKELATCETLRVIKEKTLLPVRRPLSVGSPVYIPKKDILSNIFYQIPPENRLFLGHLMNAPGKMPVYYNIEDFNTHLFMVASTGGGKSYTLGVLIEEMLECSKENDGEDTAFLIFDFHNEFGGLTLPNQNEEQIAKLRAHNLSPTKFDSHLLIFNWKWNPIKLKPFFTPERLKFLSDMPEDYSLYLRTLIDDAGEPLDLDTLEERVETSDLHHARKRAITSRIEGLKNSNLFSKNFYKAKDIIELGKATLIQMGNIRAGDWIVRFIVADLLREIYQAKLNGELPFNIILFLDEAHKFAPTGGDDPLGRIIHTIAREGRKLGLWLVISTQTSRDLSEAVMKNCNSLLALRSPKRQTKVLSRIYGISKENTEILSELSPGKGYLKTPSLSFPLMVDVRPRKTSEMVQKRKIRQKIQERVKNIALRTKERLLYTRPKEQIENFISNHKKFSLEDLIAELSLPPETIKNLLSEMDEKIVPTSDEHFYSQWFWEKLRDGVNSVLQQKGRIDLKNLQKEVNFSLEDLRKVIRTLEAYSINDNVWYSKEALETKKAEIKAAISENERMTFSDLSRTLEIGKAELEKLLDELKGEFTILPSNNIYSTSFWNEKREQIRKILEEELHMSRRKLSKKVNLPGEDLEKFVGELPVIHLQNPSHLYWEPKLEELREQVRSFTVNSSFFTTEDVSNEIGIPTEDAERIIAALSIEKRPMKTKPSLSKEEVESSRMVLDRIKDMPMASKRLIKILIENDGKIRSSKVSSMISEETLIYLKQIDLLTEKHTRSGQFTLLRLDLFLKNHFGIEPTQDLVNRIARELYNIL